MMKLEENGMFVKELGTFNLLNEAISWQHNHNFLINEVTFMYNLWLMSQMQISHFERSHSECSGHKVSRLQNFAYFLTSCTGIEHEKMWLSYDTYEHQAVPVQIQLWSAVTRCHL